MNLLVVVLSVFVVALTIYSMIDVLRTRMSVEKKMLWFALVVLFPVVGPFIYLVRKKSIVMG